MAVRTIVNCSKCNAVSGVTKLVLDPDNPHAKQPEQRCVQCDAVLDLNKIRTIKVKEVREVEVELDLLSVE